MQPQDLAGEFYQAVGQSGRKLGDTDLAAAEFLIERHGTVVTTETVRAVARRIAAAPTPAPDLADAVPYFASEAAARVEAFLVRERNERERQERRRQAEQAQVEERQALAAFEALPRHTQRKLIKDKQDANPHAPQTFIRRLAAQEAVRLGG